MDFLKWNQKIDDYIWLNKTWNLKPVAVNIAMIRNKIEIEEYSRGSQWLQNQAERHTHDRPEFALPEIKYK